MMRFVDLEKYGFWVEPRYYFFGWTKESRILGRESAVKALLEAQNNLPAGMRFKVWDMQRTREVQVKMLESFARRVKKAHPGLSASEQKKIVFTYGAKPLPDRAVTRPDCHRNGGAVDLTIVDRKGRELYMGTDHDDLTERAHTLYFHKLKKATPLDIQARQNRDLLIRAMTAAGWEMLPHEWWHWSTTR